MKQIIFICITFLIFFSYSCNTCDDIIPEPCQGTYNTPLIDVIVLIDGSSSMNSFAQSISDATSIFNMDIDTCPADLRVAYFGLETTWPGTVFGQNHRTYLEDLVIPNSVFASDINHIGWRTEQGANAIEDLSNYFDWRTDASRVIFYISDEELDGSLPRADHTNEDNVTIDAITVAIDKEVKVYAHYIDWQDLGPNIIQNYTDLTENTDGFLFYSSDSNVPSSYYENLLPIIVCRSIKPCKLNDIIN